MADLQQDTDKYVELRNINKTYGTFKASNNINLGIGKGKLIALLGPSGSGKTTILRMIAGLETADSGDIIIDGKVVNDVPASKRGIGFVFQNFNLLARTTALENVLMPLEYSHLRLSESEAIEKGKELLKMVGLQDRMNHEPSRLSGGQQQRVAIARALINDPKILFADEPTGNLDSKMSEEILDMFRRINERDKVTIILVTHEPDIAQMAKRVVKLKDGAICDDYLTNK